MLLRNVNDIIIFDQHENTNWNDLMFLNGLQNAFTTFWTTYGSKFACMLSRRTLVWTDMEQHGNGIRSVLFFGLFLIGGHRTNRILVRDNETDDKYVLRPPHLGHTRTKCMPSTSTVGKIPGNNRVSVKYKIVLNTRQGLQEFYTSRPLDWVQCVRSWNVIRSTY